MTIYRRIDEHPRWSTLILPTLYTNGERPRERIEFRDPPDAATRAFLLDIKTQCVACEKVIYPIRERENQGSLYLTVACDQVVRPACSRGLDARLETVRLIQWIHGYVDPRQPFLLFEGTV